MKEVDDGVKVQECILQRLEAASAILSARQREEAHSQSAEDNKKDGLAAFAKLSPAQRIISDKEKARKAFNHAQDDKEISRLLHWVVVGAGPTGVELCAEMSDFVRYAKQNKLDNDALLQIIVTHDLIRFYDFLSLYLFVAILRFQLF